MSLTKATSNVLAQDTAIKNIAEGTSGSLNFRNKIINGNFDIWQRGTSFDVSSSTYTADRWGIVFDGTGATRTISQQPFNLGQTDVPNEPTYYLRFQQTAAGSNGTYNALQQKIESVKTTAGKTVTISFYAKADLPRTIIVSSEQFFGTGESPSAYVNTGNQNLNITTSWQKFVVTITLPSLQGKVIGTNNNDWSSVIFYLPINTTFTIDIAQVQLEEGPVATPFEQRPIGLELSLCQRYYYKAEAVGGDGIEVPILWRLIPHSSFHTLVYPLPVPMRSLYATVSADVVRQSTNPISFSSGPEMSYDLKSILGAVTYTGSYIDLKLITVDTEL